MALKECKKSEGKGNSPGTVQATKICPDRQILLAQTRKLPKKKSSWNIR